MDSSNSDNAHSEELISPSTNAQKIDISNLIQLHRCPRPNCDFAEGSNVAVKLRRHVVKHWSAEASEFECVAANCSQRFQKVVHLTKHLLNDHKISKKNPVNCKRYGRVYGRCQFAYALLFEAFGWTGGLGLQNSRF
ncbi:hypothetical protein L3Y34_019789 [Caenorhabditis briggsae]|uniref:C2H2-type domain-containing protein n=1 Tax=Caenorhabditis briggsae TaxID=6238 RepID=A0AAE9DQR3_CAEBR|nr:hypothetical protein L3Y34_019789 [Caenorhabditis briggsae]